MILTSKPAKCRGTLQRSGVAALPGSSRARRAVVRAQKEHSEEAGRRDVLGLLGLITGLSAAQAAQAADPYEEMRALSAARTGGSSLLESFEGTKGAVSRGNVSRGIREKLAAEAAPAKKTAGFSFGGGSSSPKPSSSAVAAAPKAPKLSFSAPSFPKPAAPKPAAATATGGSSASGGGASLATGPLLQAAGVLGVVGVGASVATSAATSKPKDKPAAASAQPSRAATPAAGSTGKVQAASSSSATGKVQAGAAAAPSRSATGKVVAGAAAAAAKSATGKVSVARSSTPAPSGRVSPARSSTPAPGGRASRPSTPSLKSATGKIKAGAAAAAASGSTVKTAVKQALVNEEAPEQPTDFATGGFLGFVGLLGAFLIFGLPQAQVVTPTSSKPVDPLVEQAKQAAGQTSSSYSTPLFKAAGEAAPERKALSVAPALKAEAPKAPALPVLPPKPAAVEAPKPAAPAAAPQPAAPVVKPAAPAAAPEPAAPAAAPEPAAPVFKAVEKPAAAPKVAAPAAAPAAATATAEDGQSPSAAQNLLVVAGGIAVVVTAFALTGGSGSDSSTEGAAGAAATSTPAAAGAAGDSAAAATAAVESVSAAASAAAAATTAAPAEGAQQGNAAYDQAVMALMADPEITEDLFSVMSTGEAGARNIPALAWSLVSTPSNAERLDGFAFQKLSKQRYERVRQMLLDAGLSLPDSPKIQPGAAATLAPAGDVDSSAVDPEKLRGVFEALLANPASRTLMRQLLKGAGMPFNEEAFEEQVKDSNYFNLAIAPILRSMPQQKLRVLAELQDPEKLNQLVSSVSTLARDDSQLQAVTAELSNDVKQTVNTIREAEQRAASGSS